MDQRVERIFLGLIVIFSISFGILSVFFRSTNILGFSGEYWAGIFCVGVVLLIIGWAGLLSFRGTRKEPIMSKLMQGKDDLLSSRGASRIEIILGTTVIAIVTIIIIFYILDIYGNFDPLICFIFNGIPSVFMTIFITILFLTRYEEKIFRISTARLL